MIPWFTGRLGQGILFTGVFAALVMCQIKHILNVPSAVAQSANAGSCVSSHLSVPLWLLISPLCCLVTNPQRWVSPASYKRHASVHGPCHIRLGLSRSAKHVCCSAPEIFCFAFCAERGGDDTSWMSCGTSQTGRWRKSEPSEPGELLISGTEPLQRGHKLLPRRCCGTAACFTNWFPPVSPRPMQTRECV